MSSVSLQTRDAMRKLAVIFLTVDQILSAFWDSQAHQGEGVCSQPLLSVEPPLYPPHPPRWNSGFDLGGGGAAWVLMDACAFTSENGISHGGGKFPDSRRMRHTHGMSHESDSNMQSARQRSVVKMTHGFSCLLMLSHAGLRPNVSQTTQNRQVCPTNDYRQWP